MDAAILKRVVLKIEIIVVTRQKIVVYEKNLFYKSSVKQLLLLEKKMKIISLLIMAIVAMPRFVLATHDDTSATTDGSIKRTRAGSPEHERKEKRARHGVSSPESGSDSTSRSTTLEKITGQKQYYGNATYDALFKYVLSDLSLATAFIQAFVPDLKVAEVVEKLDEHMNPQQNLQNLRDFLSSGEIVKAAQDLVDQEKISVSTAETSQDDLVENAAAIDFLKGMLKHFEDIQDAFPSEHYDGSMDFVCRLDDGRLTLVEMQVLPVNNWDNRALLYAANLFSRQFKKGDKWPDLKQVVAINILGGGRNKTQHWDAEDDAVRHYKFQDQRKRGKKRFIDGIELIQYSLMSNKLGSNDQRLNDWLMFFRDGYQMTEEQVSEKISTEAVKQAFERAKLENMPEKVRQQFDAQDEEYGQYSDYIKERYQTGIEQGKNEKALEIACELIKVGVEKDKVAESTGVSISEITRLQEEQKGKDKKTMD